MKLTEKEFIKADGTVIKLTPEWISSKLGEVYELSHLDKIDQERLHYGYMTDELVSFLETTDKKGNPYFDRIGFANPKKNQAKYNTLRHKIILDKSSGIYDKNFIPNFFLYPTVYSESEKKKDILLAVSSFSVEAGEGELEINLNDNRLEAFQFTISNRENQHNIKLYLNIENNNIRTVAIANIDEGNLKQGRAPRDILFSCEAKEGAEINLMNSSISDYEVDGSRSAIPFKVKSSLSLISANILLDEESLVGKEIQLEADNITVHGSKILLEGRENKLVGFICNDGSMTISNSEVTFIDHTTFEKGGTISTFGQIPYAEVEFKNAKLNSLTDIICEQKREVLDQIMPCRVHIGNSTLENGEGKIVLRENIYITKSNIKNTLELRNVVLQNSDIDNLTLKSNSVLEEAFYAAPATNGCYENDSRISIKNCNVKLEKEDEQFYLNAYGNVSMNSSNFEGNFELNTYILHPYEAIKMEDFNLDDPSENLDSFDCSDEINIDVSIDNSSFINADISLSSVGSQATQYFDDGEIHPEESSVWDDPDHRRMVEINRSELSGSVELIETSLVEDSVINGGYLYNVSEVKRSYLDRYNVANEKEKAIVDFNSKQTEEPVDTKINKDNMDFEIL